MCMTAAGYCVIGPPDEKLMELNHATLQAILEGTQVTGTSVALAFPTKHDGSTVALAHARQSEG